MNVMNWLINEAVKIYKAGAPSTDFAIEAAYMRLEDKWGIDMEPTERDIQRMRLILGRLD